MFQSPIFTRLTFYEYCLQHIHICYPAGFIRSVHTYIHTENSWNGAGCMQAWQDPSLLLPYLRAAAVTRYSMQSTRIIWREKKRDRFEMINLIRAPIETWNTTRQNCPAFGRSVFEVKLVRTGSCFCYLQKSRALLDAHDPTTVILGRRWFITHLQQQQQQQQSLRLFVTGMLNISCCRCGATLLLVHR